VFEGFLMHVWKSNEVKASGPLKFISVRTWLLWSACILDLMLLLGHWYSFPWRCV